MQLDRYSTKIVGHVVVLTSAILPWQTDPTPVVEFRAHMSSQMDTHALRMAGEDWGSHINLKDNPLRDMTQSGPISHPRTSIKVRQCSVVNPVRTIMKQAGLPCNKAIECISDKPDAAR